MFHLIFHQPEIPPNTGNAMRLCANAGAELHLVRPLGFRIDDKTLTRAGMDYRDFARVKIHFDWAHCLEALDGHRLFMVSTRGETPYDAPRYRAGDAFVFGSETSGLPQQLLDSQPAEQRIRLPMAGASRSLNLSNAAAIVLYEAWRQIGFAGGA